MRHTQSPWYFKVTSAGQGLVISEATGETVAVTYNAQDAPLVAQVPELVDLVREFLCDQETLRAPIRNEALCDKARSLLSDLG